MYNKKTVELPTVFLRCYLDLSNGNICDKMLARTTIHKTVPKVRIYVCGCIIHKIAKTAINSILYLISDRFTVCCLFKSLNHRIINGNIAPKYISPTNAHLLNSKFLNFLEHKLNFIHFFLCVEVAAVPFFIVQIIFNLIEP